MQKQTHRYRKLIIGTRQEGAGFCEIGEAINCTVMNGNQTFGDDQFVVYIDIEL